VLVGDWPVAANSAKLVAGGGGRTRCCGTTTTWTYVLIPSDQAKVEVKLGEYSGESDLGPYPVPDNTPIEGWPGNYKAERQD